MFQVRNRFYIFNVSFVQENTSRTALLATTLLRSDFKFQLSIHLLIWHSIIRLRSSKNFFWKNQCRSYCQVLESYEEEKSNKMFEKSHPLSRDDMFPRALGIPKNASTSFPDPLKRRQFFGKPDKVEGVFFIGKEISIPFFSLFGSGFEKSCLNHEIYIRRNSPPSNHGRYMRSWL